MCSNVIVRPIMSCEIIVAPTESFLPRQRVPATMWGRSFSIAVRTIDAWFRPAVVLLLVCRKVARDAIKRTRRFGRRVVQLVRYRVPGECRRCPVCGSPQLRLLDPLSLREPVQGRQVGFIAGCHACGVVFTNPPPTAGTVRRFYSPEGAWGASRQEGGSKRDQKPSSRYLDVVFDPAVIGWSIQAPPSGARVLDFGCGAGGFLDVFQAFGWETWGVDPAVKTAFARHSELLELDGPATFDLVLLNHVLEHVSNPLEVLRQLAGCMRERAVVYVSVPDFDGLPIHGDLKYCINSRAHSFAFTRDCLVGLLARANLEVIALVDPRNELTSGSPVRIRVVARKGDRPVDLPRHPLRSARKALRHYHRRRVFTARHHWRWLPVRFRAALADAARKNDRRRRKALKLA